MITRYALFQGEVDQARQAEFKKAVLEELLPTWLVYPGATDVRVSFQVERDDLAPSIPLILAVDFPSREALDLALNSQERLDSRAATQRVLPGLFDGHIFHYITDSGAYPAG